MEKNDYSQVVVLDDGRFRLLSSEGIVGWLRDEAKEGLADLEEATVGDALAFEDDDICDIMSRDTTVDVAIEAFEKAIRHGRQRLQAILVTHSGVATEKPLGIVTPWDILDYLSESTA